MTRAELQLTRTHTHTQYGGKIYIRSFVRSLVRSLALRTTSSYIMYFVIVIKEVNIYDEPINQDVAKWYMNPRAFIHLCIIFDSASLTRLGCRYMCDITLAVC